LQIATAAGLSDQGVPPEVAIRTGFQPVSVTTTGAVQGAGGGLLKGPGNKIVSVTIASGSDAVPLPSAAAIGDEIIISNISATAGVIYPPSGSGFNGNSANGTIAMAASGSATCGLYCVKVTATRWLAITTTDIG
jgi:hypothetical protein